MNVDTDADDELQDWLDSLPPVETMPVLTPTPKSQRPTFEQMKARLRYDLDLKAYAKATGQQV